MTTTKTTKLVALATLALPLAFGLGACDPDESTNPPRDDVDPGWTCVEATAARALGGLRHEPLVEGVLLPRDRDVLLGR